LSPFCPFFIASEQVRENGLNTALQREHYKSEAKRWEGNYNNLYRQHVQLKRSKGLEK